MHFYMLVVAFGLTVLHRILWHRPTGAWADCWQKTLLAFLFPPLLMVSTALSVLWMGTQGQMLGISVGWIGYSLALLFFIATVGLLVYLASQGWRSLQTVRAFEPFSWQHHQGRILETPTLFAGQIGFWQPELVVSRGLLTQVTPEQLEAVLTHEKAHCHYHDTFWFFWLGWLRRLTVWMPHTNTLWQELLLLREIRADQWAAQHVDALVLAETLLMVVRSPLIERLNLSVALDGEEPMHRLEERIDALLTSQTAQPRSPHWLRWSWLSLGLIPLITIPFHS